MTTAPTSAYHALALFSGGLDSVLAAKLVQAQGRRVTGLHFISPFFGKPHLIDHWQATYGLDIVPVDVGQEYVEKLLVAGPPHGFGKVLNPCVDCKVLMLSRAKELLDEYGAQCIISGEVLGQRPMSQRRDALDIISKDAGVRDLLVRPLCAKKMAPTPIEEAGILDRDQLMDLWGRGRTGQLELAKRLGVMEIPTPAGGCYLAEKESSRRYWPVLRHSPRPLSREFEIANNGRQFWKDGHWLSIGRNQETNEALESLVSEDDLLFMLRDIPGPLALGRQWPGQPWSEAMIKEAAAVLLSFSNKAKKVEGDVAVEVRQGEWVDVIETRPQGPEALHWTDPSYDVFIEEKRKLFKVSGASYSPEGDDPQVQE